MAAERSVRAAGPALALGGMVALYLAVFVPLCWAQHSNWRALGFDTALHDQGIWLVSQGERPFDTIRGLDYFGHHVNVISLLFVPVYWLGGGIHALTAIHTVWVASAAVPLWLIARDRLRSGWWALVMPAAYLLHPATQWITWWLYHPDSMAIAPLFWAWWLASRRRWRWFAAAVLVALFCKEDVALAVVGIGITMVLTRSRPGWRDALDAARLRRVVPGLLTVAAGVAWFVVATRVVIPARTGATQPFYEAFFPSLGSTPTEIATTALTEPSKVADLLGRERNGSYLVTMVGSLAFLPLLSGLALLPGVPQLGVNLLVETVDGATVRSQYATLPLVGLVLATVETLGLLHRRLSRSQPLVLPIVVVTLFACASVGSLNAGVSPLSHVYGDGAWGRRPKAAQAVLARATRLIPSDARISASYDVDAHFSHRKVVYEWPNPWIPANYGDEPTDRGDEAEVEWFVVTAQAAPTEQDEELIARLVGPGGPYEVALLEQGVLVAKRRPAGPGAGAATGGGSVDSP